MWDEHLDKKSVYIWKETPESDKRAERRRTRLSCQSQCIASWLSVFRKEHGWVPWLKASPVIRDSSEHPCWPGDLLLPAAKLVHQRLTQQAASHKQGLHQGCFCQATSVSVYPLVTKWGKASRGSLDTVFQYIWLCLSHCPSVFHPFDPLQRPSSLTAFHWEVWLLARGLHCWLAAISMEGIFYHTVNLLCTAFQDKLPCNAFSDTVFRRKDN